MYASSQIFHSSDAWVTFLGRTRFLLDSDMKEGEPHIEFLSFILCGLLTGLHRVLESVKNGKRLSETQFSNLKVAAKGQQSVYDMFKKSGSTGSTSRVETEP